VHWSAVEFAIRAGAYGRKDGNWFVADHGTRGAPNIIPCMEFQSKWKALQDLRSRREYARSIDIRNIEGMEELGKPMAAAVWDEEEMGLPF